MRSRSGCAASARTRFWPSQPAAPVTTIVAGRRRSAAASRPFRHRAGRYRLIARDCACVRTYRHPSGTPVPRPASPCRARADGRSRATANAARERIALAIVALVLPRSRSAGCSARRARPMEEGFMLVFPERVLNGDDPEPRLPAPLRTGEPLGARRRVQGVRRLAADRARSSASLQQMRGRVRRLRARPPWGRTPRGRRARVTSGAHHRPVRPHRARVGRRGRPRGCSASPRARRARRDRRARRRGAGRCSPGVLLGLALLFRLDLVLAVGLAAIALVRGARPARVRSGCSSASRVGVAPYVVHLATAGPGNVVDGHGPRPGLRPPRRPQPADPAVVGAPRRLPATGGRARAAVVADSRARASRSSSSSGSSCCSASIAFLARGQGWQASRRDPASVHARAHCSSSRCSASGLLPQALQRVDSAHFAWVSCVPFAFLPVAIFEFARRRGTARADAAPRDRARAARARSRARARDPRVHGAALRRLLAADVRRPPHRRTKIEHDGPHRSTTASPTAPRPRTR